MEEEYDVERILDKKIKNGRDYYLVKWVGYPESQSTWEVRKNLSSVSKMIDQFEKNYVPKNQTHRSKMMENGKSPHKSKIKKIISTNVTSDSPDSIIVTEPKKGRGRPRKLICPSFITNDNNGNEEKKNKFLDKRNTIYDLENEVEIAPSNEEEDSTGIQKSLKFNNNVKEVEVMNGTISKNKNHQSKLNKAFEVSEMITFSIPEKVLEVKKSDEGRLFILVQWKPNSNGNQKKSSYVDNDTMRLYFAQLLIDYYESKILTK
jgi:hypothetical protein